MYQKSVLQNCCDEVAFLDKQYQPNLTSNLVKIVNTSFTRYTYTQVIDILLKEIEEVSPEKEIPLNIHKKVKLKKKKNKR